MKVNSISAKILALTTNQEVLAQNRPFLPSDMAPTTSRDVYGFELHCTDEQCNIRQLCAEKQAHQASKWAKYSEKKQLPKGEKLKTLCRKAS